MKKFLIKISYTVLPVWLIIVGCVVYITLYASPRASGDLGKAACIPFGHSYNKMLKKEMIKDTLFTIITNTKALDTINVDIITIGDSFSQQTNGGYQNYLSLNGLTVANCDRDLFANPFQYAFNVLDENLIDSTKTKVMIVECSERYFESSIRSFEKGKKDFPTKASSVKVQSQWSVSRARDFILITSGIRPVSYTAKLDGNYFRSDNPDKLYFTHEDIENGITIKKEDEEKVRYVYKSLSEKALEKGIKLIFLVTVDKYDLYQNHIVNNTFPKKTVLEDIGRIIGDSPNLLLTKQYLLPLIEKKEKDVFMYNDTHWSYKATKVIADEICRRIKIEPTSH